MTLWKCCIQYASKFGKLSSGHRLEKVRFHSNAKECSNYHTIALTSHASKVMLKILQASLQQYVNCELPDVQAGFRKGRGTRDQIANILWIIEKAREFQKNMYFCFIDYGKAFDCVDHNKLWKILKEMGIPDHLTCLPRNLYAGQEAAVRTGHGTTVHGVAKSRSQLRNWTELSWSLKDLKNKKENVYGGQMKILTQEWVEDRDRWKMRISVETIGSGKKYKYIKEETQR